ncbi:hypothetical protein [Streptomyces sp. S.PB5]|uniref:hypothetical protein n=1 Tax=Streptomyces sp. S.PB5 TaxID=3020844 RepID=UPI0025B2156B|nr:hypothetical protein [Streptomyces sp. S.PB5]MDN3025175.1 hypothetical protein [Streptomyces sp. S.PB5]
MVALRLTRGAKPAVQLRRLLVATAAAGTGFLLLCTLGYAMTHQDDPSGSLLRLAWCLTPLAATVYFAVTVARTDPGTRPRPGLAAIGLGPARLMAVSAATTALSCTLGSMLALLFFLHLRGDLTGMPFDGAAAEFLAAGESLPLPAALTLLGLVPVTASVAVALLHRPKDTRTATTRQAARSYGRFGAYGRTSTRETFGTYGRFGSQLRRGGTGGRGATGTDGRSVTGTDGHGDAGTDGRRDAGTYGREPGGTAESAEPAAPAQPAGGRAAGAARVGAGGPPSEGGTPQARTSETPATATPTHEHPPTDLAPHNLPQPPKDAPKGLPWGIAVLAAGLAVEAYSARATNTPTLTMPGGLTPGPTAVLLGWLLTATGLALAGPGLTHLCGRLLQSLHPGALRLLAGRVLMEEATRIGRPLGVVCAVASATYAMAELHNPTTDTFGPLTTLGTLLVTGCALATLLTAAAEAKQARADTTAALLRLGAPATMLRSAAALRTAAVLALFGPLTLLVAELAAMPLTP